MILSPLHIIEGRTLGKQLEMYMQEGYSRFYSRGEVMRIEDLLNREDIDTQDPSELYLIIARMSVDDTKDAISRMTDSAETAFYEGDGLLKLVFLPGNISYEFSTRFEADAQCLRRLRTVLARRQDGRLADRVHPACSR